MTRPFKLYRHNLLVLRSEEIVNFLDIFVVDLLQFELCILLVIFGETILDSLLQFFLDVATHITHLDLGLLGNLGTLLGEVTTTLFGGDGNVEADDLAIVLRGDAHIS